MAKKPTLGALVNKWEKAVAAKAAANKAAKEATSVAYAIECELMDAMDSEDTLATSGTNKVATISKEIVANIDDIDTLNKYIKRTGAFYLYERRISNVGFRELLESRKGKGVPGLKQFEKRKLGLTKLKSKK